MINNSETLLQATDLMHDSGFKIEDAAFNQNKKTFEIKTKEYEYKGNFISRKTNIVKKKYVLTLNNVESFEVIEKDKKGYEAVQEDYFNRISIENKNKINIFTTFHKIILNVNSISGYVKELRG